MLNWLGTLRSSFERKSGGKSLPSQVEESLKREKLTSLPSKEKAAAFLDENRFADALIQYENLIEIDDKDAASFMGLAYVHEQMQAFDAAKKNLAIVLQLTPDEPDAYFMLARIAAARNQKEEAIKCFENLLNKAPRFEIGYESYSFFLFQERKIESALDVIDRGLKCFPENANFHLIRGNLNTSKGAYDSALFDFDRAVHLEPSSVSANFRLADTHHSLQNWNSALEYYNKTLVLDVNNFRALVNRGIIFMHQNLLDDALASFDDALKVKPDCIEALSNKGAILISKKQPNQALKIFDLALSFSDNNSELWNNKSAVFIDLKQYVEALDSAERALCLRKDNLDALLNKSAALLGLDRLSEAMPTIDRILELAPKNEIAFWQRAKVHQRYSEHELALFNFSQALKLQPELDGAHFDQGFSLLTVGQLSEGWKKYEYRWKCAPHLMENRNFKTPYWDGKSSLAGKTLLIFYEAGYGDTIQFVRYFKMFAGLGCKLIFQTQPPLKKLLSNFDPNVLVVAAHETLPAFDTQIALMSLPLVFNTTLETIPTEEKYLDAEHALPGVVSRWREKILNNERKKIGLVWSGNPVHQQDTSRSISSEQFLRLVSEEFYFACLQKDIRPVDRSFLVLEKRVVEFSADLTDFVETAGLITNMDLVITVDTSIAHLAGALGKPVWVLLPFNADWRWLLNRSDSPWYPSMTLFRQKEIGNWDQVLDEVSARLKELS